MKEHGNVKFNLFKEKFAILVAKGRVYSNQRLARHEIREASSDPQPLGVTGILQAKSKILLRLHGAFMVAAWLFSAALGILLARYFRTTWKETKFTWLGGKKDAWFVFHRYGIQHQLQNVYIVRLIFHTFFS